MSIKVDFVTFLKKVAWFFVLFLEMMYTWRIATKIACYSGQARYQCCNFFVCHNIVTSFLHRRLQNSPYFIWSCIDHVSCSRFLNNTIAGEVEKYDIMYWYSLLLFMSSPNTCISFLGGTSAVTQQFCFLHKCLQYKQILRDSSIWRFCPPE